MISSRPAFFAAALAAPAITLAAAVTDGSVGPVQSLSGHFNVPQALGTVKGANLFHSFAGFGIDRGESATFTTSSAGIAHVIARVTGGQPSAIHGPLTLQAAAGARPDFYFVNPAGVLFGAGVQIDVPGGFHVSTAQQLRFVDGFVWDTGRPTASGLTVAAPEAFGFLGGNARAAVRFTNLDADGNAGDSPIVTLRAGSSLTVAANDVVFDGTWLLLPAVRLQIAATGAVAAEVPLAPNADTLSTPLAGTMRFDNSGLTTEGPGVIVLRANSIDLAQSYVAVDSPDVSAIAEPGAVIVRAAGDLSIRQSIVGSSTYFAAPGSAVDITTGSLLIDGAGGVVTQTQGSGKAGGIKISSTRAMTLFNGGSIVSDSSSAANSAASGDAGPIVIQAKSLTVDGESKITSTANYSAGSAGAVTVTATDDIMLSNGGNVSSLAFMGNGSDAVTLKVGGALTLNNGGTINGGVVYSTGNAGAMSITAGSMSIDGHGVYTGIDNSTMESHGNAGAVNITVTGKLTMANGARIQSATLNGGSANTVAITARELSITGSSEAATAITTDSPGGTGKAGDIVINADRVSIAHAGQISSSTHSAGPGGTVAMNVGSMVIDGTGYAGATGIASQTADGTGPAGTVAITATGEVVLRERGVITSKTEGTGIAGAVRVDAAVLTIDGSDAAGTGKTGLFGSATAGSSGQTGQVTVTAGNVILRNGGAISVLNDAKVADPGVLKTTALTVVTGDLRLDDSEITAAATGNADASNIDISARNKVALKSSSITTSAVDGNGGSIHIAGSVIRLADSLVTTSALGTSVGDGGGIRIAGNALVLKSGFVQANALAPLAQGGSIAIDTRLLIPEGGNLIIGGDSVQSFGTGYAGFNVIQAAAPDGVSGELVITTPEMNLAGTLSGLSTPVVDFGPLARDQCRTGSGSSFTLTGRGTPAASMADIDR